jgi:3-oxoacyl-[acyl-carrier protein] reductase
VPGDMLDAEYIKTLVKKAAEFGNGKIHIIVNNAGSALSHLLNSQD